MQGVPAKRNGKFGFFPSHFASISDAAVDLSISKDGGNILTSLAHNNGSQPAAAAAVASSRNK